MSKQALSTVLLADVILMAALALATLIPYSPALIISDLGYRSLCPFAPWSTLALLVIAGVSWALRSHIRSFV